MIEDRFYEICKQNYPIKVLTHATYEAKQTLAAKGLTPAIFLSPFYMKKGDYSMEVSYGYKQKTYKPLPDICPIDFTQYDNKERDQTMNRVIRQTIADSQYKIPNKVTKETFKNRQRIENYLNNLNFHWFENSLRKFYHGMSLNLNNFEKSTLQQPKGLAFIVEVNDKSLKQNFQKIRKQVDSLLKKMYYLNPNQVKAIPVLACVLFDPNKKYSYKDVKNYTDSLKSDFNIQSVLTAKLEINGPATVDSVLWSNYTRPIFTFNYGLQSSDFVKILSDQGMKALVDAVNIHKERIKKMIENRLEVLQKKYNDNYSVSNKLFGFFKGNTTPKQKYLVTEEAEAREIGDWMFLLQDYRKAHDVYKNILKDFEKRQFSIQMDLRYSLSLCYEMGKFVNVKVNNTSPKSYLQKETQLFSLYEKLGKKQLTKFLILFLYELHTFKIFDPNLIKEVYFPMIKRSMNMPDEKQQRKTEDYTHGHKQHFLMPTLLYEQYSNLNLLLPYIDYRRYCYDTVRVSMKFSEYKIYNHALRCLLLVENVYVETFSLVQKYIAVHLSSNYVQSRTFTESLNSMKKAWRILANNTTFHDYNYDTQVLEFKKMITNHGKIMSIFSELSPQTLQIPDDKNLIIPYVVQTDIRLSGQEGIDETDRTGITWTEISEYFNENTELYTEGYNKAAMQKIFKLFDCTYSQQKQLIYRANCQNISPAIINRNARIGYVKEPIKVCFTFYNPFIQEIRITDFKILIKDSYKNFETIKNPANDNLVIKPRKKVDVCFEIIPNQLGLIEFQGLQWVFQKMTTKYSFRNIREVQSKLKPFYSIIKVIETKGKLKVHQNLEQELFEGQNYKNKVVLQNCGQKSIDSIYIAYGSSQFYGKKYEKLNIHLQPKQKKEIDFTINLPPVPENIKKDWRMMDKKVFLYKTDGQFRVHRSSVITLINKVLFHKILCEKLSAHLHLLTFTQEKSQEKQTFIESMIIKSGFQITKVDHTKFQNTQTFYFYLLKNKSQKFQIYNFSTQERQQHFNNIGVNVQRFKNLPLSKKQDDIDIVFSWKSQNNRTGLIDIKPCHITPLKEHILPFVMNSTMKFNIGHQFSKQPFLQGFFDIRIKNIFHQQQIGIKIQFVQENVNGLYWEGITQRTLRLKHDEQVTFDINYIVSKPGVFDISECLIYIVEVDRQFFTFKHSDHQKLYMRVFDESDKKVTKNAESMLMSQAFLAESMNLSDSTLMFSKKPSIQNEENLFFSEPLRKRSPQKIDLLETVKSQDSIESPKSPKFSQIVQNEFQKKQQDKSKDQSDNLIDLI